MNLSVFFLMTALLPAALFAQEGAAPPPQEQTSADAAQAPPNSSPAPEAPKKSEKVKPKAAPEAPAAVESPLVRAAKKNKNYGFRKGIVITNENVGKTSGQGGKVTQVQGSPGAAASPGDTGAGEYTDNQGNDKEYWKSSMQQARNAITQAEERVRALQDRVNQLQNDFYTWDDPATRDGVIKPALDQALADLEQARKNVETARTRVTDLEEQARKAGALPGWLR
jgi:polyhydroxyalkanoate synthesis regulator phasin